MIDVIIPAYNAHETIDKTLFSLSIQTIRDRIHVYIVDDKSIIGYSEEIKKYSDKLKITELTLQENSGPGVARQFGIDNSNSPYLFFIDADDMLLYDNSLERLRNAVQNYDMIKRCNYYCR